MSVSKMPDKYVLDALVNDVEDIESILRTLNSESELGWRDEWGSDFLRDEVVMALLRLVRDLVRVFVLEEEGKSLRELSPRELPSTALGGTYFGMTPRGRIVHRSWEPDAGADPVEG